MFKPQEAALPTNIRFAYSLPLKKETTIIIRLQKKNSSRKNIRNGEKKRLITNNATKDAPNSHIGYHLPNRSKMDILKSLTYSINENISDAACKYPICRTFLNGKLGMGRLEYRIPVHATDIVNSIIYNR